MNTPNTSQADFWNGDIGQRWINLDDDQNHLFLNVTQALLESANLSNGMTALDIGCGTGDTTTQIAATTNAPTLGADISDVMIDRANLNLGSRADLDIKYIIADAETFNFSQKNFDRVLSRFGMMFFADPTAAMRNIARSVKPGGEIHFICWGPFADNPWFSLPRQIAIDQLGPMEPAAPNAPGPFGFSDKTWVLDCMAKAGLRDSKCEVLDVDLTPSGTPAEIERFLAIGPIASIMRERNGTPKDLQAMRDTYVRQIQNFETPEGLRIPSRSNLFSALI